MNESKVVIHAVFPTHLLSPDLPYTSLIKVVTHTDYKALEEKAGRLEAALNKIDKLASAYYSSSVLGDIARKATARG